MTYFRHFIIEKEQKTRAKVQRASKIELLFIIYLGMCGGWRKGCSIFKSPS